MGTHMCKIRKEKMMDYEFLVFCAFALTAELASMATGKINLSEFSVKLGIIKFELNMKFR